MVALSFNASTVAPEYGPEPVPNGWYTAAIDETEMKPTKDGAGAYLQIRFAVREGQYAGRKVFTRLNIQNSNATAQQIALGQLSAICHSVGVMNLQDSSQLHGIPMKIRVKLKPAEGAYEASNEITSFRDINFVPDATTASTTPANAPAAQTAAPPAGWGQPAAPAAPVAPVTPQPVAPQAIVQPAAQPAQPVQQPVAPAPAPQAAPAAQPWAQPTQAAPLATPAAPLAQPVQPAPQPVAQAPVAAPAAPAAQTAAPPWAAPQA